MQPIELIMKIWAIEDAYRAEVESILKSTPPKYLGLALANLGAIADEAFAEHNDAWMEQCLPELRFG